MARINSQIVTAWQDEEVMKASDYTRERDLIITAHNDLEDKVTTTIPTTTTVEALVEANRVGDHVGTWQGLTPAQISVGAGITPESIGAVKQSDFDALATEVNNITSVNTQLNDYPRLTGETTDSLRIQRAIDATPSGGVLHIPEGLYLADNLIINKPMTVYMEGDGIIETTNTNQDIFICQGVASTSTHKLSQALVRGVQSFFIETTPTDLNAGDMIILRDDAVRASDNMTDVNLEAHEIIAWTPEANVLNGSAMNTDTDGNGVVDNFAPLTNGSITSTRSLDTVEQAQRINVTSGGTGSASSVFQEFTVEAGKYYNFNTQVKVSGTIVARAFIAWYNGATPLDLYSDYRYLDGATDSGYYATLSAVNQQAPASATKGRLYVQAWVQTGTESGTTWFKNTEARPAKVTMTLRDYVRYPKDIADSGINLYKMNPIEGLTFNGLGFRHKEGSTSGRGIYANGVRGLNVYHLRAYRGAGSAVQVRRSMYVIVDGFTVVQPQVTGSGQGYGIQTFAGVSGVIVRNGFTLGTRHAVDFDSTCEGYVYDCIDQNGMGAGFIGSHNGRGSDIAFFRCKAINTIGHGFSFDSQGYSDPLNCTFVAFTIKDCEAITQSTGVDGIHFYSPAKQITIDGFKMRYKSGAEGGYGSLGNHGIRIYPAQSDVLITNADISGVRRAFGLYGTGASQSNDGSRIVIRESIVSNCDAMFLVSAGNDRRVQVYNVDGSNITGKVFEISGGSFQEFVVDGLSLWSSPSAVFYTGTFTAGTNGSKGLVQNTRTDRSGVITINASNTLGDTAMYLLGNGESVLLSASGAVTAGTNFLANGLTEGHMLVLTNSTPANAITINPGTNMTLKGASIILNSTSPSATVIWRSGKWYQV